MGKNWQPMSEKSEQIRNSLKVDGLLWFEYRQNNSGGYFIDNDDVSQYIIIQTPSASEALRKAKSITENYRRYCDCCGERWSLYEKNGSPTPSTYGADIFDDAFGDGELPMYKEYDEYTKYILYCHDGRVVYWDADNQLTEVYP